ncbi:lactonase family protein [Devosia sp.]|uniref:lactonase family protein n=1 Tax=Devosia sp. TaxID=1871048 RepID=UPI003BAD989E
MPILKLLSGSYSEGAPTGLNILDFDTATGTLSLSHPLPGAPDVSFFAYDQGTRRVYLTDEMGPRAGGFSLAADLSAAIPLGYQPAAGLYPCYIALSPDRTQVAVATYGNDAVAVHAIDASGALSANPTLLHGTQPSDKGHAHWVQWSPEGDRLYAVDLGHDEVRAYPYAKGEFGPGIVAHAPPKGAGPRHLAFHPGGKFAYLMTEYSNTLTALWREADGTLTPLQVITTLPAGFSETSYGAHIQINAAGTVVYVSNRGHNSIASFRIGADGHLTPLQTISCGGDWPRFFLLLDHHLIVANQRNDLLVVFTVAADGTLTPNGKTLTLGKPVALQVL